MSAVPAIVGADDFGRLAAAGTAPDALSPQPLPPELLPVEPFPMAALPDAFGPWVRDVAERMHCPPDFVAVPLLVAGASPSSGSISSADTSDSTLPFNAARAAFTLASAFNFAAIASA